MLSVPIDHTRANFQVTNLVPQLFCESLEKIAGRVGVKDQTGHLFGRTTPRWAVCVYVCGALAGLHRLRIHNELAT